MFLSSLSYEQRRVFLGLAKEILKVDDGKIDHAEDVHLRGLCSEMSLSFTEEQIADVGELMKVFPEMEARRVVLLELVALGFSNNDYHPSQDQYTDDMAETLEIPIDELRRIEALLEKYYKIQNEFIDYIEQ